MDEDKVLAALAKLNENVSGLGAKVSGLDAKVSGLDAKVSGLDAKVSGLDAKVSGLDDKVGALDERLAGLDEKFGSFRVDMMARFERVEDKITWLRDDITVNMGRAEHVASLHDGTRAEVRAVSQEVAGMWRLVRRLKSDVEELRGPPKPL